MDRRLKKEKFEWFRMFELQEVHIRETLHLGCDIEVSAGVRKKDSGIDEISLAFLLIGAKGGDETSRTREKHTGSSEANRLAIPEAENASSERREIHDRIKAPCAGIARIRIARSVKSGEAVANPVAIVGNFDGSHLRVDGDTSSCDGIESVFTGSL